MPYNPDAPLTDRVLARQIAAETVEITEAGGYTAPHGSTVVLSDSIRRAVTDTVLYPVGVLPAEVPAPRYRTTIEVTNETTLTAARRLAGENPVALSFACATRPGGGFLGGALAQEECLCRGSALYTCLLGQPMYELGDIINRNAMYTGYAIYSPNVPVFRRENGDLLDQPYPCSVITCAAPNAKGLERYAPNRIAEIPPVFARRIDKVLTIGAAHGHETIILGAWGAGAFGNPPPLVAQWFSEALHGRFAGVYRHIIFAVWDTTDEKFIGPFRKMFIG